MTVKQADLLAEALKSLDSTADVRTSSGELVTGFHIDVMGNIILEVTKD
jgi:hypothetical protein